MTLHQTGRDVRDLCRRGVFTGPTAGLAPGYTQANVVILPENIAQFFHDFCRLNPKPCPLLQFTSPGQFEPKALAHAADIRTDVPRYRVFRDGVCVDRPDSIEKYWQNTLVTFLLGCSFTFEWALLDAGLPVRHIEEKCNVPMFRTNRLCNPVGPFSGPLVVSMRPMTPVQACRASQLTTAFPKAHGAPVHVGDPAAIGIADLAKPEYGDAVRIHPGELPVFWACGVTPMEAIAKARLPFAITHEPGHMFVTDALDESLRQATRG
ncbi:MAG: putative hydro-lyase [Planctomycetota bacterium]